MNDVQNTTVLHNGRIYTCDAHFAQVDAIAWRGNRILAAGTRDAVRASVDRSAKWIDLHGRFVTPGLRDTHNHLSQVGLSMSGTDIHGVQSIADIQDRIRASVRNSLGNEWIITGLVGESVISHELKEKRYPTAEDLDKVAPNNPVCIKAFHVGILNTAAMRRLGISKETATPAGGDIGHRSDAAGELDGRFYETAWHELVRKRLPKPTRQDISRAIQLASKRFAAAGMTAVCEHGVDWDTWEAYREADRTGSVLQRSFLHLHAGPGSGEPDDRAAVERVAAAARSSDADSRVKLAGIKVFIDGGVALGTALFKQPYTLASGEKSHGVQVTDAARLKSVVELCLDHDLQLSQHVSGDAAIDEVLTVYESLGVAENIRRNRFILVHCQFPSREDFDRINRLGAYVAAQTLFLYNMGGGYTQYHGKHGTYAVPLREFVDHGCKVALGTDAPVNQYYPSAALWHATTRVNKQTNESFGIEHAITASEALALYTREAAYFDFTENDAGTLENGKLADMAIFGTDPLQLSEAHCVDPLEADCTIVDGRVVHGDTAFVSGGA